MEDSNKMAWRKDELNTLADQIVEAREEETAIKKELEKLYSENRHQDNERRQKFYEKREAERKFREAELKFTEAEERYKTTRSQINKLENQKTELTKMTFPGFFGKWAVAREFLKKREQANLTT